MDKTKLPFRPNISMITFRDGMFLLVSKKNWEKNIWKFPQGGIDEGEDLIEAGKREFVEEIGSDKFRIIGVSKLTNKYDWNDEGIKYNKNKYRGQFQHFLVVEFLGKDEDIKIDPEELKEFKWANREEVIKYSRDPKHLLFFQYNGVIEKIMGEFNI